MCKNCEVGMWEEEQVCPACGRNSRYGLRHKYCRGPMEGLGCFWAYEGVARKLISLGKYKYYFDYLRDLAFSGYRLTERPEFSYFLRFLQTKPTVVPVPLYPKRERQRGFNQAKIIGDWLGSTWHLNVENLLIRNRDTSQQVGKSKIDRMKNIKNAFALNVKCKIISVKSVLLVDDVWTTGATMNECAGVLKKNGIKPIWGLVLAR